MFSNPEQIVAKLLLHEGMRVADFGAGTGFYSKACSPYVGNSGKIYAVEVQKELVKKLENDIKKWNISNIECIWGDIERKEGTKIATASIDVVIVSNVLFQAEDKLGLVDEVKRVLRKNGRVLVVDWSGSYGGMGPRAEQVIDENTAKDLFEKRGFKFVEKINASDYHYGIILMYE